MEDTLKEIVISQKHFVAYDNNKCIVNHQEFSKDIKESLSIGLTFRILAV